MKVDLGQLAKIKSLPGPILITGHTGFKGSWLCLLMEKLGIEIVGYSLTPEKDSLYEKINRKVVSREKFADILDLYELEKFFSETRPSAVIHMAAQSLVLRSYEQPLLTYQVNALGTANILDAAFKCPSVETIVAVTTDKVYRNENKGKKFTESDPLEGHDPYSASKVAAESAIRIWRKLSQVNDGPRITSVRAGNVIGGGDWSDNRLIPDLIRGFVSNSVVQVRNPQSTRPWQHVLDPLYGYLLTLEAQLNGLDIEALNFGPTEESMTVNEVIEIAQKVWPNPTKIDCFASEGSKEAKYLGLNPSKAMEILNWQPYWNQRQAVVSTIQWWEKVMLANKTEMEACRADIELFLTKDRN